jgi:hypothetical protein
MKRLSMGFAGFAALALLGPAASGDVPASLREGGYYIDDLSKSTTRNFLNHFSYEGLNRSHTVYWTTSNNTSPGVDYYDWSYFTGHGCTTSGGKYGYYGVTTYGSANCVNLLNAGNNSNGGYGRRLKYLVLHSCETVTSPYDDFDASSKWLQEPGSIFDGLHILMGFRTQTDQDNGLLIADEMGRLTVTETSTLIVWNWMNAVDTYGDSTDPYLDEYSIYTAYSPGHFYEAAYSSFWDVYGGSQSGSYDSPSLYAMWSDSE